MPDPWIVSDWTASARRIGRTKRSTRALAQALGLGANAGFVELRRNVDRHAATPTLATSRPIDGMPIWGEHVFVHTAGGRRPRTRATGQV